MFLDFFGDMCSVGFCSKYTIFQKALRQKTPKTDIGLLQKFTQIPEIKGALFQNLINDLLRNTFGSQPDRSKFKCSRTVN